MVSNAFACEPEKSRPRRKSCDRAECTITSMSNDILTSLMPSKYMCNLTMPSMGCCSPVHDIMVMGCDGCCKSIGHLLANLLNVDVRMMDWAHPLSYRAVIGSRRAVCAFSMVLISMSMCTNLGL